MAARTVEEQEILDNIIACMTHKNLDQKDLCEYLSVSQQMFTNWKNGSSNSYLKRLPKIAEYLDIPVSYLLGKPNTTVPKSEKVQRVLPCDNREEVLLVAFRRADEKGKAKITQIAMNEAERSEAERKKAQAGSAV